MSAYFYLAMKGIKSSEGQSIIAKAAYRTGTRMEDQYEGRTYDYSRKKWIVHYEQVLPAGLEKKHPEYRNPETYWNSVAVESRPNAQPAKEIVIAIPDALTHEQMTELMRQYVRETFPDRAVLICIHHPPNQDDLGRPLTADKVPTQDLSQMDFSGKSHAHLLVSTDTYGPDGTRQHKCEKVYVCRKDGREKNFTAQEFRTAREDGWEKQYRYHVQNNSKGFWLTSSEAEQRGLTTRDRVNKYPKSRMYGKRSKDLGSRSSLSDIKARWEHLCNEKLHECGIQEEIHAGAPDNGRMATVHLGHEAYHQKLRAERLEREGKGRQPLPYKVQYNQAVREYNAALAADNTVSRELASKMKGASEKIGKIQKQRNLMNTRQTSLASDIATLERMMDKDRTDAERSNDAIKLAADMNARATAVLEELTKLLNSLSVLDFSRRRQVKEQIADIRQQIADRNDYIEQMKKKTSSPSHASLEELEEKEDRIREESKSLEKEYERILDTIPEELQSGILSPEKTGEMDKNKKKTENRKERR